MINTLKRAIARGALLVTAFFATAALAQAPSEAQRAPRLNRSAAPTTWRIARASRPAVKLPCNACRRTCRAFPQAARTPCVPSNRRLRPRLNPRRPRRRPNRRRPHRRRRRFPPQRPRSPPLSLPHPRPLQARRRNNPPARRHLRSAAPAAPITRKSALAFRRAARPPCNAWKRTRQNSRRPARRPSAPPVAVRPRQAQFPPRRPRLPRSRLPRS